MSVIKRVDCINIKSTYVHLYISNEIFNFGKDHSLVQIPFLF